MTPRIYSTGRDNTDPRQMTEWERQRMSPPLSPIAKHRLGNTFPKAIGWAVFAAVAFNAVRFFI